MTTFDRRTFLRMAGITGAGAVLAACSKSPSSSGVSSSPGAPLSGTATLTTWGGDQEIASYTAIAAAFKKEKGAEVKIEVLPYDQIRQVIDRRLQAGQPPDMFRVSYTDVGSYATNGALADLSGYMDSNFGDAFIPALWGAVLTPDGLPFGVPQHTDTSALAYNKSHFAAAGITSVPDSLENAWTWEEFVAILKQLQAANLGAAPFAFNYQLFGAYRWFNTLYQAGGTLLSDDLTTPTLNTAEATKALEWTRSLYTDGLHAPSVLVKRPTYPDEIFPTQKISMIQTGDFLIPYIEPAVKGKFEWGVTYLMHDVGAATDLGGNAIVVTEQAKNKDVAAEFCKYLVTAENMKSFCEAATVLPVRNDLVDAKLNYAVRPDLMPVFQKQATTMPPGLVAATTTPAFPGINQALVDNMDQYLSNPSASTDGTVQALTSAISQAIQAQA